MMLTEVWTFLPDYFIGIIKIVFFQTKNKTHNYVSITLDVSTQCLIFKVLSHVPNKIKSLPLVA